MTRDNENISRTGGPLQTSRRATRPERNVLGILRGLAPRRRLSVREAQIVAELQANRLLELAGAREAPVPTELITELPRIAVQLDCDLQASAMTQWLNGRWLIALNSAEPRSRQRFSLGHETKHVIDHRHIELMYATQAEAEAVAEYFSACLWMPKRLVHKAWAAGTQSVSELARLFQVSPAAMSRRLQHLGLRSLDNRQVRRIDAPARPQSRYYRTFIVTGATR